MTEHQHTPHHPGTAAALVERVGRRARATLLATAWLRAAAVVVAVVLLLGTLDYLFRLPRGVRLIHLAAMGYGAWVLGQRVILPAVRFRPKPAEIALRLERAAEGNRAAGWLASGVEFGHAPAQNSRNDLTAALAAHSTAQADAAAQALTGQRFLKRTGLVRAAALLTVVVLVAGGSTLSRPDLAMTGLARTLWPFGHAEWPKRTALVDATATLVHPIGEALPLRALLTRTTLPMGATEVVAVYRVFVDGKPGRNERVMLTPQHRLAERGNDSGELFERLIEPMVETTTDSACEIEYWFETDDNQTAPTRIQLEIRPRVERVMVRVEPPAYATSLHGSFLDVTSLPVVPDGGGIATVQPILAGSRVRVSLELNKPAALAGGSGESWSQPGERSLGYETITTERIRVEVVLVDADGLESADPLAVVLDVVRDAPAGVTVIEPAYDESVLATAVVELEAEGRDDFGMHWLTLDRQTARVPAHSESTTPEPAADPVQLGRTEAEPDEPPPTLTLTATLDLSTIGVRTGDEVWISAAGRDAFLTAPPGETDTRTIRSTVRRLRVIDETTFVDQLRGELAGVRRAAIEIDTEQAALHDTRTIDPATTADRQGAVTERLDAQRGAVDRLRQRIARNALDDETLRGMLADAAGLLGDATRASDKAANTLQHAAEDARDPRNTEDPAPAQNRVRENLETLIAMLDQGQDNWVARRTIESLLADQRALAAETEALGDRTMGQSRQQLSAEELTELERIAARQQDAAERARQALDSLNDRAESLARIDSAQADAMSRAARRGRQEQLDEQMRQAAAQLRENQTRAAAQGQQAATEALEQMLEDIDSAEASRDEALRRVLASVLESLESLITKQEHQIDSLARAQSEADLIALAQPMVALAGNTLGLLDELGPQRNLAAITSLVGEAAGAQERAVVSLREASIDSAAEAEDESLARLREARDEAERMDEAASDRENARARAELRKAYRALLEQQVALAADTQPWIGAESDRRTRAKVRGLGQRQAGVGESLADIRRSTAELAEASVFALAHRRLDAASAAATERLLAGEATASVARHQATIVRILQSLVHAMAEQKQNQRFTEQQSNGGGGGSGGGGETPVIPELSELLLLRAMQAEAMEWTRNLDESPERPADSELAELAELADLQHELAERAKELVEKLTQQQPGDAEIRP
ncbi:hypothetical protein MNBD_PLANCTO03-1216 [hydrothermal vent metagenome]|uniref:Uncharacterized protein n=1 Tax=hydrothermal vent metagenome TaxID=652676 RepID=A0A3B1E651_9ZZZZ